MCAFLTARVYANVHERSVYLMVPLRVCMSAYLRGCMRVCVQLMWDFDIFSAEFEELQLYVVDIYKTLGLIKTYDSVCVCLCVCVCRKDALYKFVCVFICEL